MYTIELWGGEGPSRNEIHFVDSKNEALASLSGFLETIEYYASDEDITENQNKVDEIKPHFYETK